MNSLIVIGLVGLSPYLGLWIFLGLFFGFFVLLFINICKARPSLEDRGKRFQAAAKAMGLSWVHERSSYADSMPQFSPHSLFKQRHYQRVENLIEGVSDDVTLAIFDYKYSSGNSANGQEAASSGMETVVSIKSSKLNIPNLFIYPECFSLRALSALGMQDIDLESHPDFSKMFVLQGDDEEAIRSFLKPEILEYFENHRGLSLEASGDTLFFYYRNQLFNPDEIKNRFSQGYEIYEALTTQTQPGSYQPAHA